MPQNLNLTLKRIKYDPNYTVGELYLDGERFCFSLEDTVREDGVKVPHKTAIPAGQYKVILDQSTRFQRVMPHILDVPQFEGIRIHSGNTDQDTDGCILVGYRWDGDDGIFESKDAFNALFEKLKQASNISISIE